MFVGFESSECECFLGAEPRALSTSGKHVSIKLYSQHFICTCVCEGWRSEDPEFPRSFQLMLVQICFWMCSYPVTFLLGPF